MKTQLLSELNLHLQEISSFFSEIKRISASLISKKEHQEKAGDIGLEWFDKIKPALEKSGFDKDILTEFHRYFESLLQYSKKVSRKESYKKLLETIIKEYSEKIIHYVEINNFEMTTGLNIMPYLSGLEDDEQNYLKEAAKCADTNCIRASILMGWCAVVNRIHRKIESIGFDKFNQATSEMKSKTFGRYKRFTKEYKINSLSELRAVFDTDLLWVLEYLGFIDVNQHERLRHCFLLRNNSGHPGDAPITGENLYSFYSDSTQIILKNKSFSLL